MEYAVVGPKSRRGKKRKRNNKDNSISNGVKTRSLRLVNRYVQKKIQGSKIFLGRITLYNSGLYRINYEDGDFEDLDGSEVKVFLVDDCDLTGKWLERKIFLDELLSSKEVKAKVQKVDNKKEPENANLFEEVVKGDYDRDVVPDRLSDLCDDTQEEGADVDVEVPLVPPPELPPSSGHIGVPDECVSHLLSVYSFLCSFSVPLFLYPFELDDFVGALNCSDANTLLDSVHVALLKVLKRHLESLSSDGSDLASKCLRCVDWNLLDTLTWPNYLVNYLMLMGHRNGQDWKGFYIHSPERDYYSLSTGKKLLLMQTLCEGVLDSEELRLDVDLREESEVGIDKDTDTIVKTTTKPRRTHHGYSKTSFSKDVKAIALVTPSTEFGLGGPAGSSINDDGNGDECLLCGMDGLLLCCDGCPSSYHSRCLGLSKMFMPDGSWYCPDCEINATEPKILRGTSLRGGEVLGVDPYEQVFVASCDHLLVLKASMNSKSCLRYYNRYDIPGVLHALNSKQDQNIVYSEICRGIMQYWEIPQRILPCNEMPKVGLQSTNTEGIGGCSNQLVKLLDKDPDMSALFHTNCDQKQKPVLNENSLDMVAKSDSQMDSSRPQYDFIMTTPKAEPTSFSNLIVELADMSNELLITCKQCEAQDTAQIQSSNGSPTSPLPLQVRDFPHPPTATKRGKSVGFQGSSTAVTEHFSEVKPTNRSIVTKKHNKKMDWGLIWSKNNCEVTGIDFRSRNILPRGDLNAGLIKPACRLCYQTYNADLMYILCEVCGNWFHADAVQLEESKISLLLGFKCSKCRRSKSPICPYTDPERKKALEERERRLAAKHRVSEMGSEPGIIPEPSRGYSEDEYLRRLDVAHAAAPNPNDLDPNDVWVDVVGAKKSRTYGVGSLEKVMSKCSTSFSSQTSEEVVQLREELQSQRRAHEAARAEMRAEIEAQTDRAATEMSNCDQKPVLNENSLDMVAKSDSHLDSSRPQYNIIMTTPKAEPISFSSLIVEAADMSNELLITCKQHEAQATAQIQNSNGSPTSPLPLQVRDFPNTPSATKRGKSVGYQGSSTSVTGHSSEVKPTNRYTVTKKHNKKMHWGLIWSKNNCEGTGIDFRSKNILPRGDPNAGLIKPACRLCNRSYNADLMYILCEVCGNWFHADAVQLEESKISLLLGFKCSKCRRSKSPICPYTDPERKKVLEERECRLVAAKHRVSETGSEPGIIPEPSRGYSEDEYLMRLNVAHAAAPNPNDLDPNDVWVDVVGAKSRTYGIDSLEKVMSKCSTSFSSQTSEEVVQLREELELQRRAHEASRAEIRAEIEVQTDRAATEMSNCDQKPVLNEKSLDMVAKSDSQIDSSRPQYDFIMTTPKAEPTSFSSLIVEPADMSNELLITCKLREAQATAQIQSSTGSRTSPLPLQVRNFPNPSTATKHGKSVGHQGSSTAVTEHSSEVKPTNQSTVTKKHNKKMHWGLIWSKNNCEGTGIDFRLKNILPRGDPNAGLIKPACRLCNRSYNADLMYIHCEVCGNWFHADAVQLEESKISLLLGFKCSKCRKIKSPICPYTDPERKKALEERERRLVLQNTPSLV